MAVDVAVLVSVGRHPASQRARRAPADARALELALRLAGPGVCAIHAGDPASPALRDYLGMGLARISVLDLPPEADPVPALVDHLAKTRPDMVFAGVRAESGEDSGLVPYLVAEALGCALVPGIADVVMLGDGVARVLQALPRGQRRAITAPLPLVATVDTAAPPPRQSAFARARRGAIEIIPAEAIRDEARDKWDPRPARPRAAGSSGAGDPAAVAPGTSADRGRLLVAPTPGEAAQAIYDYLVGEGILASPASRRDL